MNEELLLIVRAFFQERIDQIGDWCVGDIRRCCRLKADGTYENGGAMVGAFILWVCALDYLGGLLTNSHSDSRKRITSFLTEYLNKIRSDDKKYDVSRILNLRDGLVHSYSPPDFYLVSSADKNLHLNKVGDYTFLVLEEIVKDMELSFAKFKDDLLKSDRKMVTAYKYYKKYPPLGPGILPS